MFLYTRSVNEINKVLKNSEMWLITRRAMGKYREGILYVPELSPSEELLSEALSDRRINEYHTKWFNEVYTPKFYEEINNNQKALEKLDILEQTVKQGKIVTLMCYCDYSQSCHRRLVAKMMEKREIDVYIY